jgi:hypothetical protein
MYLLLPLHIALLSDPVYRISDIIHSHELFGNLSISILSRHIPITEARGSTRPVTCLTYPMILGLMVEHASKK